MMNCELFTGFFELGYFFEYMLLFALLYSVLWEAKLCWMEFRAFVHSLTRRIFGGKQHPRKYRRCRVTFDSRVYVRLFEPSSEELNERQAHWREVYARSKMIMDVDDEDEDVREDDPKEINSMEESENLLSDEEGDGTAPESEEEEADAGFPAVVDDGDDDDPVEQVEVRDYSSEPPLEQQEPLGLERSSVNGWRSVRLARKPRVSYLGMC